MVETDHDMRNSADFISLDRVARALIRLHGVAMVQSMTQAVGPGARARQHSVPVHHAGQRQRSTAPVQQGSRTPTPTSRPRSRRTLSRSCGKRSTFSRRCPTNCTRRFSPSRICKRSPTRSKTKSQMSTISSVRSRATSIGRGTVSTSPSAGRSDRCSRRSTTSTSWPTTSRTRRSLSRPWTRLFPQIIAQLKATADDTEALQSKLVNSYGHLPICSPPDRADIRRSDQRRQRLRQVPQRRLLLHPARRFRQRRRQDGDEADDVAGRQGGPVHRHPRG